MRRLTGNTAVYSESAFSGVIIRVKDDETVVAQSFFPQDGETVYDNPVLLDVTYDETDSAGFELNGHFYHLADFIREDFMEGTK